MTRKATLFFGLAGQDVGILKINGRYVSIRSTQNDVGYNDLYLFDLTPKFLLELTEKTFGYWDFVSGASYISIDDDGIVGDFSDKLSCCKGLICFLSGFCRPSE